MTIPHDADAAVAADRSDQNFTDGEKQMAATTAKDKSGKSMFGFLGAILGGVMPFFWVVVLAILLRLTSTWTGTSELNISIPAPFDGYSFSSTLILMFLYAISIAWECLRVSAAGLDQTKEAMFIGALGVLQLLAAVVALVVLIMGGSNWFTLAFANSESLLFAFATLFCAFVMIKINAQTLKRSFVDGNME